MNRCSKRTDGCQTEWYSAAGALPADWDEGLPDEHFLMRKTLGNHEAARLPDVEVRYALLRAQTGILAQAAFQILKVKAEHVKETSLPRWQYRSWRIFTTTVRPRLLVAGQLFRHDVQSLHWHESLTPYEAFVWYRDAIQTLAGKSGALAVLLKELPQDLVPHFLHGAPDYLLLRNDISMQLTIPGTWHNIGDYEASLKHKYAQRFRKVRQSWADLVVRELSAAEVEAESEKIFALYRQVTARQPVRMGVLSQDFIPVLKRAYGDGLKVWGIWEREDLVGFASGWVNEVSFDMFYIGFDYAANVRLNLYFNILFFAIEQAISLRKPLLILGRTALEAKARVGAKPQYLNTFLYIRNPVLRRIVAGLQARLIDSTNEWEQRHPFKS